MTITPTAIDAGPCDATVWFTDETVVVAPQDDLDGATAPELDALIRQVSAQPGVRHVLLDLRDVEFVDLYGLRMVEALERDSTDGAFAVVAGRSLTRLRSLLAGRGSRRRFDEL
jgi:anti-anti-sigma factor